MEMLFNHAVLTLDLGLAGEAELVGYMVTQNEELEEVQEHSDQVVNLLARIMMIAA